MNIVKSFKSKLMFYYLPTSLLSQLASSKLPSPTMASTHSRSSSFFAFLRSNDLSLLLLWTEPVLILRVMVAHDIDNISSLQLRPFSPSSGSRPFFSPTSKSQTRYVSFRSYIQRMFSIGVLDRRDPAVVRAVDCAGHSDSAPFGYDLRTDFTRCCHIQ
jgi:hypothetical protein